MRKLQFSMHLFVCLVIAVLACATVPLAAQTGFGSVAIGSSGSATATVTITTAGTLGSISVRTGGAEALDFKATTGGTCVTTTAYAVGDTCTVPVQFSPKYAGNRAGAVVLLDNSASKNVIGKAYLQGTGLGAQIIFFPPPNAKLIDQSVIADFGSVAVDGSGNLYLIGLVSGQGYYLLKESPSSSSPNGYVATVVTKTPGTGLAVDGSGAVYLATGGAVYKETPLAGGTYAETLVGSGYTNAQVVAVDAAGNFYVGGSGVLKETLQPDGSYTQTTIGTGWGVVSGIAVDGSGNLFVSDHQNAAIYKETPTGNTYTQSVAVPSFNWASGVAVNGRGDLYITSDFDFPEQDGHGSIYFLPLQTDGTYSNQIPISVGESPESLAIDQQGNVVFSDEFALGVWTFDLADPISLSFADTLHNTASSDSPRTVNVQNIGTAPLQFSAVTYPADFSITDNAMLACAKSLSVASGAGCDFAISFKPVAPLTGNTPLTLNETVTFSSNEDTGTTNTQSIPVTGTEIAPVVASPTFNPPQSLKSYTSPLTITLADATANATIFYSFDNTTFQQYTGPFTISVNRQIFAYATLPNYTNSPTVQADYDFVTLNPVFSPKPGTYSTPQTVTITDPESDALIYTGTFTNPIPYTGPITVSSTTTITAFAGSPGKYVSDAVTATYTIAAQAAAPVLSLKAGSYTTPQTVTITDATTGAVIYYTTNGTVPTASSTKYTGAITVASTETIQAIAIATGYANSAVVSAAYTILVPAATPVIAPSAGTYTTAQNITITDATNGAVIYYTTNGTVPTTSSTKYTGAIPVASTETIHAIAVATGYSNSAVASATYTILAPAATPVIAPSAGTYTTVQSVTITDATTGAVLYYTTNGSAPTTSSTKYTGAISVSSTETIQAIAVATGYTNSAVASAAYTILVPAATPVIAPSAGTYTTVQSATITDATSGAVLYYTTDGTAPTASSTKYTGAISVSSTETIQAIAVAVGYTNSAVATAAYTINLPPPAINLTASPTSLTITPGQSGTTTISVAPVNGFNFPTTFACSGLPSGATCTFAPATVTPSGGVATTTLTIATTTSADLRRGPNPLLPTGLPAGYPAATLALAACFLGFKRRRWANFYRLALLTTLAGTALLFGCGCSSKPKPVSATVTVTATSGSVQQTVPLAITIE